MPVAIVPAVVAGLVGGVVMTGAHAAIRAAGLDLKMDVTVMWARLVQQHGSPARLVGLAIHVVVSLGIGLLYASGFQLLGITDNASVWGVAGGLIHWVLAGLFLSLVPPIHPEVPARHPAPGAFASGFGARDVAAFLVLHLLYGLIFGVVYASFHPAVGSAGAF